MESQIQHTASEAFGLPGAAIAKKRFQIEKIEERMAPTAYGGPNKKSNGADCDGGGGGGGQTSSGWSAVPSFY